MGLGAPRTVEVAWGPVKSNVTEPVYVAPITLGGSAFGAGPQPSSIASGKAPGGLNIAGRDLDAKVLVASNPSGVLAHFGVSSLSIATRSGAGVLKVMGPGIMGGEIDISDKGEVIALLKDAGSDNHFLVTRTGDDTLWNFHVWSLTSAGIDGPAQYNMPKSFGKLAPSTSTSKGWGFTPTVDPGTLDGPVRMWSVTPTEFATAAKAMSTIELGDVDAPVIGGAPPVTLARKKLRKSLGSRHAEERATKATARVQRQVNVMATPGLEETMLVAANDETDGCPFQLDWLSGDQTTPVNLADSTMQGCWDLPMPVVNGDFCGVGGDQIITVAAIDTSSRTMWTWQALLWMRMGDQIMATELGTYTLDPQQEAEFIATDVNGDGLVDLIVTPLPTTTAGFATRTTLLSDGLGGNLGPSSLPAMDATLPELPSAGTGLPAGQVGCGNGLLCSNGKGTKNTSSSTSAKPQLL